MEKEPLNELQQDWAAVGADLLQAIHQISEEIGDADLTERVKSAAYNENDILPHPLAIFLLENHTPGAAERVMTRTEEIGEARHKAEMQELEGKQTLARSLGRILRRS